MYFFFKKMRRSRSLTFKKEQEQKQPPSQPQRTQSPKLKSPPPQLNRPQQTKINYQSQPQSYEVEDSDNDDVPLSKVSQSSKQHPKKQSTPKPEEEDDDEEHDDYEEEEDHEEEEELTPPPKTRPSSAKPKQTINLSTQEEQPSPPVKQRGRSPGRKPAPTPPVTSSKSRPIQQEPEENHDQEEEEEVRESKEGSDKRKRLILSKTLFQKLLSTCEIESTTIDIINHTEADLIEYVQDVIKVISNNEEDDEVVVRDSSLKFLGDKSKAQGLLDQKTFDKIFQEAISNVSSNITFTSEAYKSLCKYTEVHILDMLTKVKAIMKHSGRKRLNTSDVELLKFILE